MKNTRFNFIFLILSLLFCFSQNSYSQVTEEWVVRYTEHNATPRDMGLDSDGNIYVAGSYGDYCVIKYDPDGNIIWEASYDSETQFSSDNLEAMALDSSGNVYVTGRIPVLGAVVYDYATVKFDKNGNRLWIAHYDGGNNGSDRPYAICTDQHGNVYVTGESGYAFNSDSDYGTVKYDSNGNEVWVARYKGPDNSTDVAYAITIDDDGSVVVTGTSSQKMTTIKYNASGIEQWVVIDSAYCGRDMVLDSEGNIYITGSDYRHPPDYSPLVTIKYDPDGNTIWKARYGVDNLASHSNHDGVAIALDRSDNVYVTGSSKSIVTNIDYAIIKYDGNGNQL
ncbi:SBBP repeat-containing protein [Bacteroidota bacterium]